MGIRWIAALAALSFSCGDSSSPKGATANPAQPGSAGNAKPHQASDAAATASKTVELAASPDIDLVDNRYLWHLYTAGGLLLPIASEGMRKYNHEYSQPWKKTVTHDGRSGKVLASRQSTLVFHWFDDASAGRVVFTAHGLTAGQRVTVTLNGKRLGDVTLPDAWERVDLAIADGILARGENSLTLHVAKQAAAGAHKSYALWHSVEILAGEPASEPAVRLDPAADFAAGADKKPALTGFPRMVHVLEVPRDAWLEVYTAGKGQFSVRATRDDGKIVELLEHEQTGEGWQLHQVSLSSLADTLIALELRGPAAGAWGQPRLALAQAKVRERPEPAQNAILLVVDALRSDHVPLYRSVYGEDRAVAMPHTEKLAAAGSVVYLHNQAASPSSPPSHGSIQTGMIPRVHGVDGDKGKLVPGTPMISTQVVSAGISAGYFGNNPFGMGRLEAPGNWTEFRQPSKEGKSNDCTTLVEMILDFASKQSQAGKRFFVSALPYETHTPYRYHEGITEHYYDGPFDPPLGKLVDGDVLGALSGGKMTLSDKQWAQLKGLYRGEAEYWDQCLGQLVDGLRAKNLLDDTALVLTSDHGEGMYEHGKMGHAFGHYRELGDVPLAIFWPALSSQVREVDTVTTHRDIAPTILDLLGVPIDDRVQGESVLPLALREGAWTPRVVSLEYGRSYSLRSQRYKLIVDYNGGQEAYDLIGDPWEQRNNLAEGGLGVRYLRDLMGFFLEYRSRWRYQSWGTLNRHGAGFLAEAAQN